MQDGSKVLGCMKYDAVSLVMHLTCFSLHSKPSGREVVNLETDTCPSTSEDHLHHV